MRGKGVPKMAFLLVYFALLLGPKMGSKICPKFDNFWVQFWVSFFWGLGVLWVSFGSLLGPLDALLGGPKSEKMVNVPRENNFFENADFCLFEALDGPLGFILVSLGPVWSKNGPQHGFQRFPTS